MIQQFYSWAHNKKIGSRLLKKYLNNYVHSSIIHSSQKVHQLVNWCIHTKEYYLAIKRKKVQIQATTKMKLESQVKETRSKRPHIL